MEALNLGRAPRRRLLAAAGVLFLYSAGACATSLLGVRNPAEIGAGGGSSLAAYAHFFEASDFVAVSDIDGFWAGNYSPRSGDNLSLLVARAEAGAYHNGWGVALLRRREILIRANRELLDAIYANQNRATLPVGKVVPIDYDFRGFDAEGVKFSGSSQWDFGDGVTLSAGAGVSLLRGIAVKTTRVRGSASMPALNSFSYSLTFDEAYTDKTYPFLKAGRISGDGYGLDLGLELKWGARHRLEFAVADALGKIRWKDIPSTAAVATSNTTTTDAGGFIVYKPALTGQNRRRDFVRRLDPKAFLAYEHTWTRYRLKAGTDWTEGEWFPTVGAGVTLGPVALEVERDLRFGTNMLGLRGKWGWLQLRTEDSDLRKAKGYGFSAGINIPLHW